MDVGISDAARRNGGDVSGQFGRADILGRHALFIMNAVPVPARAAAANGQYAIVIFHRTELDLVGSALFHDGAI